MFYRLLAVQIEVELVSLPAQSNARPNSYLKLAYDLSWKKKASSTSHPERKGRSGERNSSRSDSPIMLSREEGRGQTRLQA